MSSADHHHEPRDPKSKAVGGSREREGPPAPSHSRERTSSRRPIPLADVLLNKGIPGHRKYSAEYERDDVVRGWDTSMLSDLLVAVRNGTADSDDRFESVSDVIDGVERIVTQWKPARESSFPGRANEAPPADAANHSHTPPVAGGAADASHDGPHDDKTEKEARRKPRDGHKPRSTARVGEVAQPAGPAIEEAVDRSPSQEHRLTHPLGRSPSADEQPNSSEGMYQSNVRGVRWRPKDEVWEVWWYEKSGRKWKHFSAKEHGVHRAKALAEQHRLEMESTGQAVVKKRSEHQSGVRGVSYDKKYGGYWTAEWREGRSKKSKYFSVKQLGYEEAKQAAIAHRREMEQRRHTSEAGATRDESLSRSPPKDDDAIHSAPRHGPPSSRPGVSGMEGGDLAAALVEVLSSDGSCGLCWQKGSFRVRVPSSVGEGATERIVDVPVVDLDSRSAVMDAFRRAVEELNRLSTASEGEAAVPLDLSWLDDISSHGSAGPQMRRSRRARRKPMPLRPVSQSPSDRPLGTDVPMPPHIRPRRRHRGRSSHRVSERPVADSSCSESEMLIDRPAAKRHRDESGGGKERCLSAKLSEAGGHALAASLVEQARRQLVDVNQEGTASFGLEWRAEEASFAAYRPDGEAMHDERVFRVSDVTSSRRIFQSFAQAAHHLNIIRHAHHGDTAATIYVQRVSLQPQELHNHAVGSRASARASGDDGDESSHSEMDGYGDVTSPDGRSRPRASKSKTAARKPAEHQSAVRGVSWSEQHQAWQAQWSEKSSGKRERKRFYVKEHGYDKAKALAERHRLEMERTGQASLQKRSKHQSGVRGVHYAKATNLWIACWHVGGRKQRKSFSVAELGYEGAKNAAINHRCAMLQRHYTSEGSVHSVHSACRPQSSRHTAQGSDTHMRDSSVGISVSKRPSKGVARGHSPYDGHRDESFDDESLPLFTRLVGNRATDGPSVERHSGDVADVTSPSIDRRHMESIGRATVRKRSEHQSGVKGVYYHKRSNAWTDDWRTGGKKNFKSFSVKQLGYEDAMSAAIAYRRANAGVTAASHGDVHPAVGHRSRTPLPSPPSRDAAMASSSDSERRGSSSSFCGDGRESESHDSRRPRPPPHPLPKRSSHCHKQPLEGNDLSGVGGGEAAKAQSGEMDEARSGSDESVRCWKCGKGDNEKFLLLCDNRRCSAAYHTYCINLTAVPEGQWFCPECRHSKRAQRADPLMRRGRAQEGDGPACRHAGKRNAVGRKRVRDDPNLDGLTGAFLATALVDRLVRRFNDACPPADGGVGVCMASPRRFGAYFYKQGKYLGFRKFVIDDPNSRDSILEALRLCVAYRNTIHRDQLGDHASVIDLSWLDRQQQGGGAWIAQWYEKSSGKEKRKTFYVKHHGFDKAKALAEEHRLEMDRTGRAAMKRRSEHQSGVKRVRFDKTHNTWEARWKASGQEKTKSFSVKQLGYEEAKGAAISHLRAILKRQSHTSERAAVLDGDPADARSADDGDDPLPGKQRQAPQLRQAGVRAGVPLDPTARRDTKPRRRRDGRLDRNPILKSKTPSRLQQDAPPEPPTNRTAGCGPRVTPVQQGDLIRHFYQQLEALGRAHPDMPLCLRFRSGSALTQLAVEVVLPGTPVQSVPLSAATREAMGAAIDAAWACRQREMDTDGTEDQQPMTHAQRMVLCRVYGQVGHNIGAMLAAVPALSFASVDSFVRHKLPAMVGQRDGEGVKEAANRFIKQLGQHPRQAHATPPRPKQLKAADDEQLPAGDEAPNIALTMRPPPRPQPMSRDAADVVPQTQSPSPANGPHTRDPAAALRMVDGPTHEGRDGGRGDGDGEREGEMIPFDELTNGQLVELLKANPSPDMQRVADRIMTEIGLAVSLLDILDDIDSVAACEDIGRDLGLHKGIALVIIAQLRRFLQSLKRRGAVQWPPGDGVRGDGEGLAAGQSWDAGRLVSAIEREMGMMAEDKRQRHGGKLQHVIDKIKEYGISGMSMSLLVEPPQDSDGSDKGRLEAALIDAAREAIFMGISDMALVKSFIRRALAGRTNDTQPATSCTVLCSSSSVSICTSHPVYLSLFLW
ncbi:unnamed protein product [Vitrella brassicaformis CCMP3155]|uniref:PHD-type domain-containing protein n=1 Tax=Vitrella brassicaformis (strain CCMP3155) TaxID=1169540 RepID=A0A0G4F439_VITBC|nr:unnamed protein product [Vitrella brassicaformis CCMP3155]|eukprot:CEM06613.1 unnamed protein product [Vitrella brassicaformis CCMP3155]